MSDASLIGISRGPGETAHDFTFVSSDPDQRVKYGEFVYYTSELDGQRRDILARVTERAPVRLLPETLMSDPVVDPAEMAGLLGFSGSHAQLFQMTAVVMGYHDPVMGFVNPRIPPRVGAAIRIAPSEMLVNVLTSAAKGEIGSVHIGSLLSRDQGDVPIVLDANGFTSTHLAIIASTGAGKSYLAAVMIEELMRPNNRAAVLIVDPHGEYSTLTGIQGHDEFKAEGYAPRVSIKTPESIKVKFSSLTAADLRYLLPNLSDRMDALLSAAFRRVSHRFGKNWTHDQLLVAIRGGMDGKAVTDPEDDRDADPSVGALVWRIEQLARDSGIFSDHVDMPLRELLEPGQCTILQLDDVSQKEQSIVVATLLRQIYQARIDSERGQAKQGDPNYLPYPAFVLIEEAHNFAPSSGDIVSTGILKRILAEGRKFGMSIGLISQRPGKLNGDVLSQCMTQCIMRIVNPVDQGHVAESVESVGRDLLKELPSLSRGQVIVAGVSTNTPVLVRVRQRITRHGAQDLNAPLEWRKYFSAEEVARRDRDNAPPSDEEQRDLEDMLFRQPERR